MHSWGKQLVSSFLQILVIFGKGYLVIKSVPKILHVGLFPGLYFSPTLRKAWVYLVMFCNLYLVIQFLCKCSGFQTSVTEQEGEEEWREHLNFYCGYNGNIIYL